MTDVKMWLCVFATIPISIGMLLISSRWMEVLEMSTGICYVAQKKSSNTWTGLILLMVVMITPSVVFISVYIRLLVVTYNHAQKIRAQELPGALHLHQGQGIFVKIRSIKRALCVTVITVGWFVLTWSPVAIWMIVSAQSKIISYSVTMFVWWLLLCLTFGNMIGLVTKKAYRDALMEEVISCLRLIPCTNIN